MQDDNLDVRLEIKVAMFWRKLIGDMEYARFLPADLFRWYMALELAGPDDVRELYHRRQGRRTMKIVQGLVDVAPHPPATLVEIWLESHETKIYTAPYWYGAAVFFTLAFMFGIYMNGFQNLQPASPLYMNPPQLNAVVMSAPTAMPIGPSTPMPLSPVAPVMQLPISPTMNVPLLVSQIPVQPALPGSTIRTSPLQESAQSGGAPIAASASGHH
jgi:hypothetical protein